MRRGVPARLPRAHEITSSRTVMLLMNSWSMLVAEARLVADLDRAARRGLHGGPDDVPLPVALAGRDVAGQDEIGQRRERDVVRAADARLQHAAAPDRNAGRLRDVVDLLRFGEAADAAQLDVDDAAGPQLDRLLGVMRGADALVEADRRLETAPAASAWSMMSSWLSGCSIIIR